MPLSSRNLSKAIVGSESIAAGNAALGEQLEFFSSLFMPSRGMSKSDDRTNQQFKELLPLFY